MYQMTQMVQIPITTTSTGDALLTLYPYSAFYSANLTAGTFATIPFATVSSGTVDNPFAGTPSWCPDGPFHDQRPLTSTFSVDACKVGFQET